MRSPYTGLKPAGLSVGPVIPLAEEAIDDDSLDRLAGYLTDVLRDELGTRLDTVQALDAHRQRSLADERRYVGAVLDYQVSATTCTRRCARPITTRDARTLARRVGPHQAGRTG